MHDVTQRVEAERQVAELSKRIAEQERLRSIGIVAAGIAHDLRNTFHAIGLRLHQLRHDEMVMGSHGAQVDGIAVALSNASERIARFSTLATGRAEADLERVDLALALLDAIEIARPLIERREDRARPIVVQVELEPSLPPIVAAPAELRHVVVNLLLNARDAMPGGGVITVKARHAAGFATVTVSDEGGGLDENALAHAFEPFFTTKGDRGTGVGLATAADFMRRIGGYIAAENREGGGARFTLTLRAWRDAAAAEAPAADADLAAKLPADPGR
ncbi:MAG TPA: ATP-binding protein [Anaeromyxobacteraceae bacterium]|nr:ATP-binding protein [Anaeromyxobacteraceae bacterium]